MKYVDLTHMISENMPVYPGTEQPTLKRLEIDGYRETLFNMFSHTGTHVDAPYHILKDGKKLEEYRIDEFIGKAVVIQIPENTIKIEKEFLKPAENAEFVLLHTGWSKKWEENDYFYNFPVLSIEAAKFLAGLNLKGIGLDCISVDEVGLIDLPVHRVLLKANMLIIENLTNLDQLPEYVNFTALPLKFKDSDGFSVRAFASF